jgi:VWFA-related protein
VKHWHAAVLGLALLSVPPQPLASQDAAQFKTRVDLMQIDVSVRDKKKEPVRGLTAADFTILENGKKQAIQTFVPVNLAEEPPSPPTWMRDVAPDVISNTGVEDERLVVIVMDDFSEDVSKDLFAIRSAKEIARGVIERLGPHDLAAVVFTVGSKNNQEFTHDRQRLLAAVDQFNPAAYLPQFSAFAVLERVCEVLGSVQQRRKALIWVSAGVVPPGTSLRTVIDIAQAGNVNIYPIDPAGIRVGNVAPASSSSAAGAAQVGAASNPTYVPSLRDDTERMNNIDRLNYLRQGMYWLAGRTGGTFFQWNEFQKSLNQVFRETGAFYLLGYASSIPVVDDKPRTIEVKVNRPGVTVSARSGYFPKTPTQEAPLPPPPSRAALEALAGLVPVRGVPLSITAVPFATGAANGTGPFAGVAVALGLPAPAEGADDLDVLIKAFTFDGVLKQTKSLRAHVDARASAVGSDRQVQIVDLLDLPPGRYQLRAGVTSALHQTSGSVYADLDVPDFAKAPLSISGVALNDPMGRTVISTEAAGRLPSVVPMTTRAFEQQARIVSLIEVYSGVAAKSPPVVVDITIKDVREKAVFKQVDTIDPPSSRRRVECRTGSSCRWPSSGLASIC